MKIFLCHSSRIKPLVREIRGFLPHFLATWIDEDALVFGDDLPASIHEEISTKTDYVLLFIDHTAIKSEWVRREIGWALAAEKEQRRTILLPIAVERPDVSAMGNVEFTNRKYLVLKDMNAASVHAFAAQLSEQLFALVCRDVERMHRPAPVSTTQAIASADELLLTRARLVHKIVFPHREANPIRSGRLREILSAHTGESISYDEFDQMLMTIAQRGLLPGLAYDGHSAFLVEEHSQWKSEVEKVRKERVALRAIRLVKNGMSVMFDAGSTSEAVVRLLCRRIESRAITKIEVATTSVNIADMISDCCVSMGFDDDYSAVSLFIPGGRVRPNTQAIVGIRSGGATDISTLADRLNGFDLSFVGVNGVCIDGAMTTHSNSETSNKAEMIRVSSRSVLLGDCSKLGIRLESQFASLAEDVSIVLDGDDDCDLLRRLVSAYGDKVILAP